MDALQSLVELADLGDPCLARIVRELVVEIRGLTKRISELEERQEQEDTLQREADERNEP